MHPTRIDAITRLFADRKLSRRQSRAVGFGGERETHCGVDENWLW